MGIGGRGMDGPRVGGPMRALGVLGVFATVTIIALLLAPTTAAVAPSPASAASSGFNRPGDLLITDQFNNRVIEVNPLTKAIVWSFGSGNSTLCNPGPGSVIGPNSAERLSGGLTLISGTGIPSGVPGTTACVDNRVIVVDQAGTIVWQYGVAGRTSSGLDRLNVPVFAIQLPNHNFLIVDQGNNRVIEVNFSKQIVWSYGPASGPGALNSPNSAELLGNGNFLIADEGNNRVIEVTPAGRIVWEYSHGLSAPAFASQLPGGDILITDGGNNRVIQVTPSRHVVFQYYTNRSALSNAAPMPSFAEKIAGGDILIADQFNDRVILIDASQHIVFQYGAINAPGVGFDQLFGPYSAEDIGQYVGQTVPPSSFR
jgi:hypothetical protein